jgi:hypothetical protein
MSPAKSLLAAVLLSGCVTPPMGPTALVMPGQAKPFEAFAGDQATCKQFASGEVDGGATLANLSEFGTTAMTAALGAGLGGAVRGTPGAEVGGGVGAFAGLAASSRGAAAGQGSLQSRYNLAYVQCMYARGNQIATAAPAQDATPRSALHNTTGRHTAAATTIVDQDQLPPSGPAASTYPGIH